MRTSLVQVRREPTVYPPGERPDVQVLVDGVWCAGELRMWSLDEAAAWWGSVSWRRPGELSSKLDRFPADRIREDPTDYSRGR